MCIPQARNPEPAIAMPFFGLGSWHFGTSEPAETNKIQQARGSKRPASGIVLRVNSSPEVDRIWGIGSNKPGARNDQLQGFLGFPVWGLGFRVEGLGFKVWGLGFRV